MCNYICNCIEDITIYLKSAYVGDIKIKINYNVYLVLF